MAARSDTFPRILMGMLNWCEDNQQNNALQFVLAWLPSGDGFVILNIQEFSRLVLPRFFKHSKYNSFTRRLYRWGFRQRRNKAESADAKITNDVTVFAAKDFHRDHPELCVKMKVHYSRKELLNQACAYAAPVKATTNFATSESRKFVALTDKWHCRLGTKNSSANSGNSIFMQPTQVWCLDQSLLLTEMVARHNQALKDIVKAANDQLLFERQLWLSSLSASRLLKSGILYGLTNDSRAALM